MKNQLLLTIPKPCSEKWSSFSPASKGGFCNSCSKVVIDFSQMSDEEILSFFDNHTGNTCGRFRPDQLKVYQHLQSPTVRPGLRLLKAGVLSMLLIMISKQGSSQSAMARTKTEFVSNHERQEVKSQAISRDHLIKGVVKGEDGLPIPGANILLKGSEIGTSSDADGNFEFPQKLNEGDVLIFTFIGYVPTEYKIPKHSLEVVEISLILDFDIMGEVAVGDVYENPSAFRKFIQKIKHWF